MKTKDPSYRALLHLGERLRVLSSGESNKVYKNAEFWSDLDPVLEGARQENAWFTEESCLHSLKYWGEVLTEDSLENWLSAYQSPSGPPLRVALIMAGNIPLVGFHDLISVLLTGNNALVKCATKDTILLKFIANRLSEFDPNLKNRISFSDGKLGEFDAVIATGSTNTSRYFEYYFSKKPHIIRKNRHGVAVLTGGETPAELSGLAEDVFRYFGMGCRSISKLFVPKGYNFDPLFNAFYPFKHLVNHQKYGNNYDYNKAVYLMSGSPMLDNGFLLLKEDKGIGSPIGTLFYEHFESEESVRDTLHGLKDKLQCIAGAMGMPGAIPLGSSQKPLLSTYADGVDTVDFLLKTSLDSPASL
jgi:hypothetical protein